MSASSLQEQGGAAPLLTPLQLARAGRGRRQPVQAGDRRRAALPHGPAPRDRGVDRRRHAEPHAGPGTPGVCPDRLRSEPGKVSCVWAAGPCDKVPCHAPPSSCVFLTARAEDHGLPRFLPVSAICGAKHSGRGTWRMSRLATWLPPGMVEYLRWNKRQFWKRRRRAERREATNMAAW